MLTRPDEFDVIATMNLNGDYLSDALAAQVGGIGIAPGGNINYVTGHAMFEATHGTAPKYANLDKVNPGSVILSGEMMLRYMGWVEAADAIITRDGQDDRPEDRDVRLRAPDGRREGSEVQRVRRRADQKPVTHVEGESALSPPSMQSATYSSNECAAALVQAFADYNAEFRAVTRRAPQRFEARDWRNSQRDAVERIELYDKFVNRAVAHMRDRLGEDATERALWSSIKRRFTELIDELPDLEFDKTFFNSVTRRTFGTIGVDGAVEFIALDLDPIGSITSPIETNVYSNRGSLELLFEEVLADFRFRTPYLDFDRSVRIITNEVRAQLEADSDAARPPLQVEQIEFVRTPFFQISRAYLVGRISGKDWALPFVLALKNTESGVLIDAVMMDEASVSILFSFTRSYFHADLPHVGQAVVFLKIILPRKPISELYTVLGRAKQGKTERYRELFRHLQQSTDRFVHRARRARAGDGRASRCPPSTSCSRSFATASRIRRTSCAKKS